MFIIINYIQQINFIFVQQQKMLQIKQDPLDFFTGNKLNQFTYVLSGKIKLSNRLKFYGKKGIFLGDF